jgi:hypothetical protein
VPVLVLRGLCAPQEKKKREKGQVSRGTSYVQEEKRQARQFNQYSGFD